MEYTFDSFNPATGQLVVSFKGQPSMSIDVPIEDGKYLTGEHLHNYVRGFVPTWYVERLEQIQSAPPENASEIIAMCTEGEFKQPEPDYRTLRANAYPAFTEYLDGLVKGDTAQMQEYLDRCVAVKAMFPKPPENDVSPEVLRQRLGT